MLHGYAAWQRVSGTSWAPATAARPIAAAAASAARLISSGRRGRDPRGRGAEPRSRPPRPPCASAWGGAAAACRNPSATARARDCISDRPECRAPPGCNSTGTRTSACGHHTAARETVLFRKRRVTLKNVVERRGPENLPDSPGVYLFRGDKGKLLYVGKALSLRKRVASYFNPAAGGAKEEALRRLHREVETISTRTELEALLLENTLIKKHRPRYNVCLRDDKTYPYIKITTGEPWPRALVTRRVEDDGHSYYGPFWGGLARRIMRMITRHFQIRTCTIEIDGKLPRPCLYYDLHACLGPCVAGLTTKQAYDEAVRDVLLFLQGRNKELEASLTQKMRRCADEENFEMAAAYRDAIRTVEDVAE